MLLTEMERGGGGVERVIEKGKEKERRDNRGYIHVHRPHSGTVRLLATIC